MMRVNPGYQVVPQNLFGPRVDLEGMRATMVIPAGQGPITSPHPESVEIACMRTLPGVFNVCSGKGGF